jgi:hypothetical protein
MRNISLAFLALVVLSSVLLAQKKAPTEVSNPSIEIAGVTLRLGMTEAQVEEKLSGARIKKAEEVWVIGDAGNVLEFTGGLLSFAGRSWTTNQNDISEALFGAVSILNKEGFSRCNVSADIAPDPDTIRERVTIDCGGKSVRVVRSTVSGKVEQRVMEQLGHIKK